MNKESKIQNISHLSILHGATKTYSTLLPHQIIEQLAQQQPHATALIHEDKELTYSEVNNRANQLAEALTQRGIKQGCRCGVSIAPSFDIIVSILAIHKIGATYLPLDPEAPTQRLEYILKDAQPSITLTERGGTQNLELENLSTLILDDIQFPQSFTHNQNPKHTIADTDIANIFYTSGTTGHPKGVLVSYKNYRNYINVAIDRFSMNSRTVMPAIAKFTFSISLFELMTPLVAGGSVRLINRESVLKPLEMIKELQASTMAHIGPSLWIRLLSAIQNYDVTPTTLQHMHHVSSGGDLVPPELLEQLVRVFSNAEVFVVYGCSEISCMGTAFLVHPHPKIEKTLVGSPFNNTHVAIINYHTQEPVPIGKKGEICFSSDGIASDYIGPNNSFKNKIITIDDRSYYRTGDVGRITQGNQLEMLGREDFQVKISGVRIELSEIDYHLRKAPHIEEAISMFWRSDSGENRIFAYTTKVLTSIEIQEVRTYLQLHLIEQMQPKSFIQINALPLNPNFKVDRNALPKPSLKNIIREAEFGAAATHTQKKLLTIWKALLGYDDLGIDDDFFYSGGSSLQGVDLMQRIDNEIGLALPLNLLMINRTIRSLSAAIDNTGEKTPTSLNIILKKSDSAHNIFFIHDGNGEVIPYASLSQQLDTQHSIHGIIPPTSGYASINELTLGALSKIYAKEIVAIQPKDSIIVGGLCIGGYLAYCVAAELESLGREVSHILLFDSHYIDATPKPYDNQRRKDQIQSLTTQLKKDLKSPTNTIRSTRTLLKKAFNFIHYKISDNINKVVHRSKISLLRISKRQPFLLQLKLPFPSVDNVLRHAEKAFTQRPTVKGKVILFRATTELNTLKHLNINDTPYSHYFEGEDLGWSKIHTEQLSIHPIGAGHSTILTPPYNLEIAGILIQELQ